MDNKNRDEMNPKYFWDLDSMYKNNDEIDNDIIKAKKYHKDLLTYKGSVIKSSKNLFEAINLYLNTNMILEKMYAYSFMKSSENTDNDKANILSDKILKLYNDLMKDLVFLELEIIELDESDFKKYLEEEPKLKTFKRFINDILKSKKHILSESEEVLLSTLGEVYGASSSIYSTLTDTDMTFEPIIKDGKSIEPNFSNYYVLLKDKDKEIRKNAFTSHYNEYKKLNNTLFRTYKSYVTKEVLLSKIKKYDSVLDSVLYSNNIDKKVYTSLLDGVNNNLSVLHEYTKLKKELSNQDEFHMYDFMLDAPFDVVSEYTYEEGLELIKEALKPLGDEYVSLIDKAHSEKWMDVYPNKNKSTGAYSYGTYESKPFILLNFMNNIDSIFAMAHELGHSIHSHYSNQNQDYVNADYPIFLAEIASTVNEVLLNRHLFNKADDVNLKKYLIVDLLDTIKGKLFRQTMFAEFEYKILSMEEQGLDLSKDIVNNIYYDLNKKYYGDHIIHDEEIKYEWTRVSHFYRAYYVYQYATGITVAIKIVDEILKGNKKMLNNYKEFLKSGCSKYPTDLLKEMGIKLDDTSVYDDVCKYFMELINEYKKL